jgi:hypothetical protein
MASLVLIESNGTIKTLKSKEISNENLYKKCGFRVSDDFLKRHTWRVKLKGDDERYNVSLWAKKTGKANFENKYEFPQPVDKDLYFGTCAIVRNNDEGEFIDLVKGTWEKIYEKLFGGFEDLGNEDEYSDDELANVDPKLLTSQGYLKDDFVVSDKDQDQIDDSPPDTPITLKKADTIMKKVIKAKESSKASAKTKETKETKGKKGAGKKAVVDEEESQTDESMSELGEETYMFSDED